MTVVSIAVGSDDGAIKGAALTDAKVVARLAGHAPTKVIVVRGKLVNLVVKG